MSKKKRGENKLLTLLVIVVLLFGINLELGWLAGSSQLNLPFFKPKTTDQKALEVKFAQQLVQKCGTTTYGEMCYADSFGDLTKQKSLDFAVETLKVAQTLDPQTRGCHLIAHKITLAETGKQPLAWKELLAKVDANICTGGFVHGVLEAHSRFDHNFILNAQSINDLCAYVGQHFGVGGEFNCSHILGHILMADQIGSIESSVKICSQIAEKLRYECYSGVFMENETRDNLIAHGLAQRISWDEKTTADQEVICHQNTGVAATACWREMAHMYAFINQNDPLKVYQGCSRSPDTKARDDCYFHSLGVMAVSSTFDNSNFKTLCTPFSQNKDRFTECFTWSINSLIASSPEFIDKAIVLCQSIPNEFRQSCFGALGKTMLQVPADKRQSLCQQTPEEYRKLCAGI